MHQTEKPTTNRFASPSEHNSDLRNFGLLVGAVFLAIGLWPLLHQASVKNWALFLAVTLILPALIQPRWLRIPHAIWMKIGAALGWFNTRLILGLLYLIAIVPIAIILRCTGKTPLQLKFDKTAISYREKPDSEDDQNITQQF